MTPEQIAAAAQRAGIETGEVYPSDTAWRRRFVELVEDSARGNNAALREALSYYAETSNWRRDVHTVGLRKAWKKPNVASDRGGRARLALMTMEGSK